MAFPLSIGVERAVSAILLGALLPGLTDSLFSTQGIMVMLLVAYAGAMWMFLTSAPKVYTMMVSDLEVAREFYEGVLCLSAADVPLHYYYNYEQTLGTAGVDPLYMPLNSTVPVGTGTMPDGLWYQLKKNTQLHVIAGANPSRVNPSRPEADRRERHRHVCFDRKCLDQVLGRVRARRLKYKIRRTKPLNFLVKDLSDRVIEMAEVTD
ncbi:VOC family protein [Rubidibacter lacunae]|nr:glyoxalase-like domain protein [Rubidibacter lacunae]